MSDHTNEQIEDIRKQTESACVKANTLIAELAREVRELQRENARLKEKESWHAGYNKMSEIEIKQLKQENARLIREHDYARKAHRQAGCDPAKTAKYEAALNAIVEYTEATTMQSVDGMREIARDALGQK